MTLLTYRDIEPRHLTKQYQKVLSKLQAGDFRSADVKKMPNCGLYRAKLDKRTRLLFQIVPFRGETVILVLEVVHNHDYAKARFLCGGGLTEGEVEQALLKSKRA